jgi:putative nucleotidyltransferase with HDIG domain
MKKQNKHITITNPLLQRIGALADEQNLQAYVVGGYVRDYLLGLEDKDVDILVLGDGIAFARLVARNLGAESVVAFERFGTAMVQIEGSKVEFVGARKERYAPDSRKPEVVTGTLRDDLERRDFTVNAMAASLNKSSFGTLYDEFGGIQDLHDRILRTPLEPAKTFDDDPLRIMRAIRFAAQLNFTIHPETRKAITHMKDRLAIVSQERITDEFLKILKTPTPSVGLRLMYDTGVLRIVFPEIADMAGVEQRNEHHHKDVFLHTCTVVDNIARTTDNVWLRFAALVHDIAKPKTKAFKEGIGWTFHGHEEIGARMMKGIFRRLRLPMDRLPYVEKLVRLHLRPMVLVDDIVTDSAVRRLIFEAGNDIDDLMKLCRADITSKNPKLVQRHLRNYDIVMQKIVEVEEKDRLRNWQPPVKGDEIMAVCGLKPGKEVGILKKAIEEAILDGKIPNEHDAALAYLLEIKDDLLNPPQSLPVED